MLPTVCVAVVAVFAPDLRVSAVRADWHGAWEMHRAARRAAGTPAGRAAADGLKPDRTAFARRFVTIAAAHPGTQAELNALCWAALNAAKSDEGRTALAALTGGRVARADPAAVLAALRLSDGPAPALAPALLACAKRSLEHPDAARLLAEVCAAYRGDESESPPAPFREAADLIASRFAGSRGVLHFPGALYQDGAPPWVAEFEPHLRALLVSPGEPAVRQTARYAQAVAARAGGAARQAEAKALFRRFVADFTGVDDTSLEEELLAGARRQIAEIEGRELGKPAQDIAGVDLAGKPLTLSEHKGKVVLLVFWWSGCVPCMTDVPHEKELVAKFAGRPFMLLGVNGDPEHANAVKAVEKVGMPWRSVRNKLPGSKTVSDAWAVGSWPTVVVIDHAGVIRHDSLRGKRLDAPLEALVAAAEAARK